MIRRNFKATRFTTTGLSRLLRLSLGKIIETISKQLMLSVDFRPNHPWYNYLTADIPRVQHHSKQPSPVLRSKSSSMTLEENFQRRQTSALGINNEETLRQIEAQKRQTANNLEAHAALPQENYEARPQLRSAMRNSRYQ